MEEVQNGGLKKTWKTGLYNSECLLVLESPVPRLQKDRDLTGPRPARTANFKDRQRPKPRSGLRSFTILTISRPEKDRSDRFQPVFRYIFYGIISTIN